jgi:hypothetical protein
MNMFRKNAEELARFAKAFLLAVLLLGASGALAAWTAPTQAPPGGNTAAPINVDSTSQTKTGNLIIGSDATNGVVISSNGNVSPSNSIVVGTLPDTIAPKSICLNGLCISNWSEAAVANIVLETLTIKNPFPPSGTVCYNTSGAVVTCEDSVYSDDASTKKVCQYAGYNSGYTGFSAGSYDSPSNNYVLKWNAAQGRWIRYSASGNNSGLTSVTCVKLTSSGS